ncbi:Dirigent protein 10 [Sarracenia purpurea var. burkii]
MATHSLTTSIISFLLAIAITCTTSVRILGEEVPDAAPTVAPEVPSSPEIPFSTVTPLATAPSAGATAATSSSDGVSSPDHALITFFMHDIIGGSNPTARAITGIVTNPAVNGQVPFAKPNGAVLPVNNNGVPANNAANSGFMNNNNIPFLTGLGGNNPNVIQNNGNGNNVGGGFPAVTGGGQLPSGTALQKLMFGTMTAFDDELTEGHELGSGLVGKAQGFYVASSEDGGSQTMAFTAMFESGGYGDSISFFGVHRVAVSESHLAIMGGTGKYVNAKGYATLKTFLAGINYQHSTDGVETLLQITLYLTY